MANNYQLSYGQSQPSQNMPQSIPQFQSQQFFPQPQGNVYTINNSLEVANVPMSAGLSVALTDVESLSFSTIIQVKPSCCAVDNNVNLTFVNTGIPTTFSNINVAITKLC